MHQVGIGSHQWIHLQAVRAALSVYQVAIDMKEGRQSKTSTHYRILVVSDIGSVRQYCMPLFLLFGPCPRSQVRTASAFLTEKYAIYRLRLKVVGS